MLVNRPEVDLAGMAPSEGELEALFEAKYRRGYGLGWGPALRRRLGYVPADDYYEAVMEKLVTAGCAWMDVGCGRDLFPSNRKLAERLSSRARVVFGVDPDDNIKENPFVTDAFQGSVEDIPGDRRFDVVSLRMVAEHIERPATALASIGAVIEPGGLLVVYTPNKWSPMSLAAAVVPFSLHNALKQLLWRTQARDTFPTVYRLNTRRDLERELGEHGFRESLFVYLDDCSVFQRYRALYRLEIGLRNLLHRLRMRHPENCLLGVYRRAG